MSSNRLWESHRLILPEMREKALHTCGECRFFVEIQGREETRFGCVVSISRYGDLKRRVPRRLHAAEILRQVGKEGLQRIIRCHDPEAQSCALFQKRL